jgi:hypothetical protein
MTPVLALTAFAGDEDPASSIQSGYQNASSREAVHALVEQVTSVAM